MVDRPRVFLDTSALFSAIWSSEGGARALLVLGEQGAIRLLASSHVLAELESVLRRKAPGIMGLAVLLLDQSRVEIVPKASRTRVRKTRKLVAHRPDAQVLADASASGADFLVTLDRQHLLMNEKLGGAVPYRVGTPGDCLEWIRSVLG